MDAESVFGGRIILRVCGRDLRGGAGGGADWVGWVSFRLPGEISAAGVVAVGGGGGEGAAHGVEFSVSDVSEFLHDRDGVEAGGAWDHRESDV